MYVGSTSRFSDNPSPTWMTSQVQGSKVNSLRIHEYIRTRLLREHQITLLVGSAQSHEVLVQGDATCFWLEGANQVRCLNQDRKKRSGDDSSEVYW